MVRSVLAEFDGLEQRRFVEGDTGLLHQRRQAAATTAQILFGLPVVAAQLLLEGDALQAFDALGERRLLVEVPEEAARL